MRDPRMVSDDWTKNYQASIAVKITSMVLWVIIVVVFIASTVFLNDLQSQLETEYSGKADEVAYQVAVALNAGVRADDDRLAILLADLNARYRLSGIRIALQGRDLAVGDIGDDGGLHRDLSFALPAEGIFVDVFPPALDRLAREQRNHLVIVAFIVLLTFGLFLTWSIRTIVHEPLQQLVSATRAISDGQQDVRLEMSREDEFGYLSRFFNQMLDRLMAQQRELQMAVASAQSASRAKSAFLANMSHELRTPLNAIIGYSEMLKEDAEAQGLDVYTPDLKRIHSAGTHLLSLINDILDLSKIEAGKVSVELRRFPVDALIDDVINTVKPLLDRNRNRLAVDSGPQLGQIYSDETKLRQVLVNLLGNAAKFTEDGVVTLSTRRVAVAGDEWLQFAVSDTGIGIPSDQIARLFTDFTQVDSSTTRKYGGTGLGLAISRRFCQRLGGDIDVTSEAGRGSTFNLKVPARTPELNAAEEGADRHAAVQTNASGDQYGVRRGDIALVDDGPVGGSLGEYPLGARE
jgi:signal transduction histidine kinase